MNEFLKQIQQIKRMGNMKDFIDYREREEYNDKYLLVKNNRNEWELSEGRLESNELPEISV
ncbi:hypothetical protein HXZ94_06880 [Empedobacter falsenii]|uniref:hypothetical protein n=1 Tax=Empedobacter falsenii TaxID=343874 RepID=UPI002578BB40|nr:hypothetical protein [Empedobacter falsenii]MDM1298223.1 hypothetical protein [Empedobacter falsenii]MDM1318220.1 hypothetical protein [Empedobacter falsenii]